MSRMKIEVDKKIKIILYFVSMCYAVVATLPSILTGRILDKVVGMYSRDEICKEMLLFLLVIIATVSFGCLRNWLKSIQVKNVREWMERKAFKASLASDDSVEASVNVFDTEINLVINRFVMYDGSYILVFVPFSIALFYSLIITYQTILIIVGSFIFVTVMNQILLMPFSKYMDMLSRENEKLNSMLTHYLKALTTLKIYGGKKLASETITESLRERNKKNMELKRYLLIVDGINTMFSTLLQLLPLAILVYMVIMSRLSIGGALSIMLLLEKIVSAVEQILAIKEGKASAKAAMTHINSVIETVKEEANDEEKMDESTNLEVSDNVMCQSASNKSEEELCIEISNLCVSYGNKKVLDGFNHTFNAGRKYLILGENGAGKSTLLKVLSGQIREYEGSVRIKGIELREMERSDIYRLIGILPQTPEIFSDSVVKNIALNDDYDEMELQCLLDLLELNKEENSSALKLSLGEKQRISVARMLAHPKACYFLDEILCGLDQTLSRSLEEILLKQEGSTILHISHRSPKELMSDYDEIVQMSKVHG